MANTQGGRAKRGFAVMSPEQRKRIASIGGRSVPKEMRSFSRDRALAARAGRIGGQASHTDDAPDSGTPRREA